MAFNRKFLNRVSAGSNTLGTTVWSYNGTATGSNETNATIVAANYFDGAQVSVSSATAPLAIGDTIICVGNNSSSINRVTAITPHVTLDIFV